MTSMSLLDLLDDDLVDVLTDVARRDKNGLVTVPGVVSDARWRRTCRRALASSRRVRTPFDADITYKMNFDDPSLATTFPISFKRGLRLTTREQHLTGSLDMSLPISLRNRYTERLNEFFLLRDAETNRLHVVVTPPCWITDTKHYKFYVWATLGIKSMLQILSGNNADYPLNIHSFDSIVAGKQPSVYKNFVDQATAAAKRFFLGLDRLAEAMTIQASFSDEVAVRFAIVKKFDTGKERFYLSNGITIASEALDIATTIWNPPNHHDTVPYLCQLFGYYDAPLQAQCGGWMVHLLNHDLPANSPLMPKLKKNNAESYRRCLASFAMDKAERDQALSKQQTTMVVFSGAASSSSIATGPQRRSRLAASAAKVYLRASIQEDNNTLKSGRKRSICQYQDPDSRHDEAEGLVDDQYADLYEHLHEPATWDSDGEYVDTAAPKRSKAVMEKERRAEEEAIVARRRRLLLVPSSSDDDDDE